MSKKIQVTVEDWVYQTLQAKAAKEKRTLSQAAAVVLTESLSVTPSILSHLPQQIPTAPTPPPVPAAPPPLPLRKHVDLSKVRPDGRALVVVMRRLASFAKAGRYQMTDAQVAELEDVLEHPAAYFANTIQPSEADAPLYGLTHMGLAWAANRDVARPDEFDWGLIDAVEEDLATLDNAFGRGQPT